VFPIPTWQHNNPANIRQRVLAPAIVRANARLTLDKPPLIAAGLAPHSVLALLGRHAWALPKSLDRGLRRLDVEGATSSKRATRPRGLAAPEHTGWSSALAGLGSLKQGPQADNGLSASADRVQVGDALGKAEHADHGAERRGTARRR
jgi:hypothetical protein